MAKSVQPCGHGFAYKHIDGCCRCDREEIERLNVVLDGIEQTLEGKIANQTTLAQTRFASKVDRWFVVGYLEDLLKNARAARQLPIVKPKTEDLNGRD